MQLIPGSQGSVVYPVSDTGGVTTNGAQGYGVQGDLEFSGNATMTRALLGSVRTCEWGKWRGGGRGEDMGGGEEAGKRGEWGKKGEGGGRTKGGGGRGRERGGRGKEGGG